MQIKTLVITVVTVVACLLAAVGTLGVYSANEAVRLMQTVSLQDAREELAITKIRSLMETNRSQVLQALQHNPATEYAKMHDHPVANHFKAIDDATAELSALWSKYESGHAMPEEKQLAADWYAKSGKLGVDHIAPAAAGIKAGQWDLAQDILIKRINPTYRQGDVALKALTEFFSKKTTADADMVGSAVSRNSHLMLTMLVFGLLFTIGVGVLLMRTLKRQLGGEPAYAKQIVSAIANGDLSAEIRLSRTDRESLLFSMKTMQGSLSNMVGQIRHGTESIATASGEIASGNLDLSSRTEQQASSLEETASSMEELTSTVKQNADNARQANGLALTASEVAMKGGAVVAEVVNTMGSINESSRKIVDIIAVIDGIAFQTNILALNAAVEAARAGEQGRGFAVVASEVRNLAQRSAAAAKEIKTLIGASVEKVDAGARLVDQAGTTMNEIVESVKRVTEIMGAISAASQEQNAGIEQINQAITQMDEVTQQNAALVEEAAAAAQSLQNQAANLSQVVSVFNLGSGHDAAQLSSASAVRYGSKAASTGPSHKSVTVQGSKPARPTSAAQRRAVTAAAGGDWEEF